MWGAIGREWIGRMIVYHAPTAAAAATPRDAWRSSPRGHRATAGHSTLTAA